MKQNRFTFWLMIVTVASLLSSCMIFGEEFGDYAPDSKDALTLNFVPQNLEALAVGTRAVDAKVAEETALNDVHIFIFKDDGTQFYHKHLSSNDNEDTKTDIINPSDDKYSGINTATIFVIANFKEGFIDTEKAAENGYTLSELQGTYIPATDDASKLPATGMPMIGSTTLDWASASGQVDIKMFALLARLDFRISLKSTIQDESGTYPQMTLKSFTIHNAPKSTAILDSGEELTTLTADNYFDQSVNYSPSISNNSGEIRISLYTFENKRGVVNDYTYPEGLEEDRPEDKQRYKVDMADEKGLTDVATYFTFSATYWDYNGVGYDVVYTLYVGANNTNNFNIKRNHQYKSHITITGMKTNDNLSGNTLDTRVAISESAPFVLSILQERSIDAHFAVIPLDIYLANAETDRIRIEIVNDGSRGFMKIDNVGVVTEEGAGKLNYFYSDLMTNYATHGLSNDISGVKNKERIYIYLDENISLKSRVGRLNIYYNDDSTPTTTMAIEQTGLIPVEVGTKKTDGTIDELQQIVFCESYEEYLDFYDPKQEYNSPNLFPGLPWGATGTTIENIGSNDARNNYTEGKIYTKEIIRAYGTAMSSLYLNGTPTSAAAYCAHKNKRNSTGEIDDYKWCMPGIRQLEGVLTANYNTFAPIRDGAYYWSSAVGKKQAYILGFIPAGDENDPDRARATSAYLDGTVIRYADSDKDDKYENEAGGSALRTEVLRIRAIYHPAVGEEIDEIEYTGNPATDKANFITNYN